MSVLFEMVSRRSSSCTAALTIPVSRPVLIILGNPRAASTIHRTRASAIASLSFFSDPTNRVYLELAHVIAIMYFHPFCAVGSPSTTSIRISEFGNLYFSIVAAPCNGSFRRFARWQISHVSVNVFMCLVISGHHITSCILRNMIFAPGCPTSGVECVCERIPQRLPRGGTHCSSLPQLGGLIRSCCSLSALSASSVLNR